MTHVPSPAGTNYVCALETAIVVTVLGEDTASATHVLEGVVQAPSEGVNPGRSRGRAQRSKDGINLCSMGLAAGSRNPDLFTSCANLHEVVER